MTRKPDLFRVVRVVLLCLVLFAGAAQAYEMTITAPDRIQRGLPLVVNGTSNIPPGTTVEIVFTKSGYYLEEVTRESITLQANQEFSLVFDTSGLTKGIYKVEVLPVPDYRYLGNSTTLIIVEIIDRSDELKIYSPKEQEYTGELAIDGAILAARNAGVEVQVNGPSGIIVFGPEYVKTNGEGTFSLKVNIDEPGIYNASFSDAKGFVARYAFTIEKPPEPTTIPTTVPTTTVPVLSATAESSRDKPAYFAVQSAGSDVRLFTSSGIDWVIEYTDANGTVQKVNYNGAVEGEEVVVPGTGGVIQVEVYPNRYSESGTVTLSAQGAANVTAQKNPPGTAAGGTTIIPGTAPLPVIIVVFAVIGAVSLLLIRRRNRRY
jgi:hypothetical protein